MRLVIDPDEARQGEQIVNDPPAGASPSQQGVRLIETDGGQPGHPNRESAVGC